MPPPPLDLVTALGRLLRDPALRERFARDPAAGARALDVRDGDREALAGLDPAAVERQARTLVEKRLHEVARLLPLTFARLGAEARRRFLAHAPSFWPTGHARHMDDAVEFARLLVSNGVEGVCRAEANRVCFSSQGRRLALHAVGDLPVGGRPRRALQLLYRGRGGATRELAFFIGI